LEKKSINELRDFKGKKVNFFTITEASSLISIHLIKCLVECFREQVGFCVDIIESSDFFNKCYFFCRITNLRLKLFSTPVLLFFSFYLPRSETNAKARHLAVKLSFYFYVKEISKLILAQRAGGRVSLM
jgi:hypothetical protein